MPRDKKKWTMGSYSPTKEEQDAFNWGINNHIRISPVAVAGRSEWKIAIQLGDKKANVSKDVWGPVDIWKQLYDYYLYYFNKRKL